LSSESLQEPVILNVKGLGYKIHASLAIEARDSWLLGWGKIWGECEYG